MFRSSLNAAVLCVAMTVGVGMARATVVVQPSLEQMTHKSQVIIHAVVEDQSVTLGEGGRILTLSRLRVKDGVKGVAKANDTVTLYQVGGTKDGRTMSIPGVNTFTVGEEVIVFGDVFLAQDTVTFLQTERKAEVPAATLNPSAGWLVTFGIGLGKYVVARDGQTPMAVEQVGDVATAVQGPNGLVIGGRVVRTQQPLGAFLPEVRRMVRGAP